MATVIAANDPATTAAPYLLEGRPDWSRVDFDLECPRCAYNLRMLPSDRCPECGLDLHWADMIHAHFTIHRFLFEHQCLRRPIASYFETLWKSLRPASFWAQVQLHDRVHVGPLSAMLFLSAVWFALFAHVVPWLISEIISWMRRGVAAHSWVDEIQEAFEGISIRNVSSDPSILIFDWGYCCMVLGSLALVLVLRQTLGRCRVRSAQVLRVVAYSTAPGVIAVLGSFVAVILVVECLQRFNLWMDAPIFVPILLMLLAAIPYGLVLARALRLYLHLPRSLALGVTASFVGVLSSFAIPTALYLLYEAMGL